MRRNSYVGIKENEEIPTSSTKTYIHKRASSTIRAPVPLSINENKHTE